MAPFRNNLTLAVVDVDQLLRERPDVAGRLLRELVARIGDGTLHPLPVESLPARKAAVAVRKLARAEHIGKLTVSFGRSGGEPAADDDAIVRPDGTYLITGGLGGLGLLTARLLAEQGARHLVLLGRRAPSPSADRVVAALREAGVEVATHQVDVADRDALRRVLAAIDATLPPVRGVVHAAGFLEDRTLAELSWDRFQRVLEPKVLGAWNLHLLTRDRALDFFVLFSSVAAVLGTPGQANYAAGNAFMDALAHYRVAAGLPATAINWGAWAEVGGAARPDRGGRLAVRGLGSIPPERGLEFLTRLLADAPAQVAVVPFDLREWSRFYPSARRSAFLGRLGSGVTDAAPAATASTDPAAAGAADRRRAVERYLCELIAGVVRLPVSRVRPEERMTRLGVDSLMAVELRNRLDAELGVTVAIVTILKDPTVGELAGRIAEQVAPERVPAAGAATSEKRTDQLLRQIGELSEGEVDALLRQLIGDQGERP